MKKRRHFKKDGKISIPRGTKIKREKIDGPGIKTKSGVFVRSQYEKICADYLFENGIKFYYEPLMLIRGKQYRPDFYLPDEDFFIEICGYNHMPYYRDRTGFKEKLYAEADLKAAFIYHSGKGSLIEKIESALEKADF